MSPMPMPTPPTPPMLLPICSEKMSRQPSVWIFMAAYRIIMTIMAGKQKIWKKVVCLEETFSGARLSTPRPQPITVERQHESGTFSPGWKLSWPWSDKDNYWPEEMVVLTQSMYSWVPQHLSWSKFYFFVLHSSVSVCLGRSSCFNKIWKPCNLDGFLWRYYLPL